MSKQVNSNETYGSFGTHQNPTCHRHCNASLGSINDDGSDGHQSIQADQRPLLSTQGKTRTGRDRSRGARKTADDIVCVINETDDDRDPAKTVEDIQQELDEVVNIMVKNMELILDRDAKIEDLEITAENIREQAKDLRRVSKKILAKYYWRRNRKLILVVLSFFCLIVGIIVGLFIPRK